MKKSSMSRRRFLQSSGAAALWLPTTVQGYTANEIQALYVDGEMQENISKFELDTPSLCVDLDLLEANIATMQATTSRNGIASRPHAKTHKTPIIAQMQMDSGSVGICSAKISEAEVMYQNGLDEILLTTTNVTPTKIKRAMNLAENCPGLVQATDSPENARLLSEAATAMGITANISSRN